jgi:hypothetical protein
MILFKTLSRRLCAFDAALPGRMARNRCLGWNVLMNTPEERRRASERRRRCDVEGGNPAR